MKRSDALPPARNGFTNAYRFLVVMLLCSSFAWLTGCAGVSSGGSGSSSQIVVSGTIPSAQVGVAVNAVLSASGGKAPYTFSVLSGSLPAGLGLVASVGEIQGTPTKAGAFTFAIQATDSTGATGSNSFQMSVSSSGTVPLSINTTSLPNATAGTAYSDPVQASGGTAPYYWSVSAGKLPTSIGIGSNSGVIQGTTTQNGSFNFTIEVGDSSSPQQVASQSFALTVNPANTAPLIATSFFGADFNSAADWPPTDGLGTAATLGGIRLWDDGVKWADLNTANGVYDFTGLDAYLDNAQAQNMDVLYTFGNTPQFAAITTPPGTCGTAGPYSCAPPIDVNADGTGTDAYFQAYVTALVTHAAGRISYYELWNEPDCTCFWAGTTAQLVRMGQDAAAIIRSLDPGAKILSPSAHGDSMATWFDGYVAAGGASNFDIVNVHMRGEGSTNATPETFLTVWGQVQTEVQARNLTAMPIWDDEHGILTGQITDPDELAGFVARSAILRAGVGVQRQYVYMWDSVAPYGLQGSESGTAWDQVAGWLIGHSISPCVASGSVYTCQVDDGQIVWDASQTCSSGTCTTSSYTYPSNYVYYRLESSNTQQTLTGTTVQIGYKPIFLTNQ